MKKIPGPQKVIGECSIKELIGSNPADNVSLIRWAIIIINKLTESPSHKWSTPVYRITDVSEETVKTWTGDSDHYFYSEDTYNYNPHERVLNSPSEENCTACINVINKVCQILHVECSEEVIIVSKYRHQLREYMKEGFFKTSFYHVMENKDTYSINYSFYANDMKTTINCFYDFMEQSGQAFKNKVIESGMAEQLMEKIAEGEKKPPQGVLLNRTSIDYDGFFWWKYYDGDEWQDSYLFRFSEIGKMPLKDDYEVLGLYQALYESRGRNYSVSFHGLSGKRYTNKVGFIFRMGAYKVDDKSSEKNLSEW